MKITFNFNLIIILLLFFLFILLFSSCSLPGEKHVSDLRLGFMPNVTHATALVGVENGFFQKGLGRNVKLKSNHFIVGNSIIDAFITNQIDLAYIGPGPFINAIYRKVPIMLLSGAAYGGTVIVGNNLTKSLSKNSRIAIPQHGNTQDLILRLYLERKKMIEKVKVIAIPPQDTGTAFFTMSIDAACLPEPWGTILLSKDDFNLIEDEKSVLNKGFYPVTLLVVNSEYEKKHSDIVKKFVIAHEKTNDFISTNPELTIEIVTKAISNISKKQIDKSIVAESLKRCTFLSKLDLNILKEFKIAGVKAGYYKKGFLNESFYN